jgi:hypothetical protein
MEQKREIEEREVGFLVSPTAHFVSLVDRGANQIPFRIVKCQGEENDSMKRVVHKVIAPKDLPVEEMTSLFPAEADGVLKFDKGMECGSFAVYEQLSQDAFEDESFEVVNIDPERGVRCVVGALKQQNDGFIARLIKKRHPKEVAQLDEEIPSLSLEDCIKEYTLEAEDQLWSAMGAIGSILMMEGFEPNERMKMISKVLDGLKAYFGQVFQVTQKAALPVRVERPKVEEREEETVSEEQVVQKSSEEETHEPVKEPTDVQVEKSDDAADVVEDSSETEGDFGIEGIKASFEALKSEIEALKSQLKELEELRASVSEISEKIQKAAVPPTYRQSDDGAERKTKKQSVFKGVFQF